MGTAGVAFEHIAAYYAAGTVAMVGVDHPATCGGERSLALDSERRGACHLDPSPVTYPVVDRGLGDDAASGLILGCAAAPWGSVPCCFAEEVADGKTARPCLGLVFVASEMSCRTGSQVC